MLKKILSCALAALLLIAVDGVTFGQSSDKKESEEIERIRTRISRLDASTGKRLVIKTKDGMSVRGRLIKAEEGAFSIASEDSGDVINISYLNVKKIKEVGDGPKIGGRIGKGFLVGIGATAGVVLVFGILIAASGGNR